MNTCLYRHFDEGGTLLYVGISLCAAARLAQHKDHSHWFARIRRVEIQHYETREDALAAEAKAIVSESPVHNIKGRAKPEPEREREPTAQTAHFFVSQIVRLNPVYTTQQFGELMGMGTTWARRLIESGQIGHVALPRLNRSPKLCVTGWQVLEYLESLEGRPWKKSG